MLSICIPVYNFNMRSLVEKLHNQAIKINSKIEIYLLDDGSKKEFCISNRQLDSFSTVKYEELPANVGRSKIRNILAQRAKNDYLLFLDCDSDIESDLFLSDYDAACRNNNVIYGGRTYGEKPSNKNYFLQWYYTTVKNGAPFDERSKSPYYSFCTNNFLVSRKVLLEVPFNEELKGWGHEDTLFAYELKSKGYKIAHINNPILHKGYVTNREYIENMLQGLMNLIIIYETGKYPEFTSDFKTLHFLDKVIRLKMLWLIRSGYWLIESFINKNVKGSNPKLFIFDVFKLGNICKFWHQRDIIKVKD
ncbi:MAG: glycosyltransferase [Bacteroidota bacterium]|nr:glycosyltransferase [Bacteroidota bacterium]